MSKFINAEALYKAKAEHFENECKLLQNKLEYYVDLADMRGKILSEVERRIDTIEAVALNMKATAKNNCDLAVIGQAIMNGKNNLKDKS